MNLKKNNNEDHNVFTKVGERNEGWKRRRNGHRWYTAHIWSAHAAYNGKGDREKSTKTTKEIF